MASGTAGFSVVTDDAGNIVSTLTRDPTGGSVVTDGAGSAIPTVTGERTSAGALTIPPDWQPAQPGCDLNRASYYKWVWGTSSWAIFVLGAPAQTTACLPPGRGPDATFEATQCPSGYTAVASACDWAPDAAVCCPTRHAFSCYAPPASPYPSDLSYIRCASRYLGNMTIDAISTDLEASTEKRIRQDITSSNNLYAVAIVYTTPTSAPANTGPSSAPPQTSASANTGPSGAPPPDSEPSSAGLSANARIGVGVGVGVGVLLAAAVFFMFRRRRRRKQPGPGPAAGAGPSSEAPKGEARAELANHRSDPTSTPSSSPYPPYPVVPGRHEMAGDHNIRSELP